MGDVAVGWLLSQPTTNSVATSSVKPTSFMVGSSTNVPTSNHSSFELKAYPGGLKPGFVVGWGAKAEALAYLGGKGKGKSKGNGKGKGKGRSRFLRCAAE